MKHRRKEISHCNDQCLCNLRCSSSSCSGFCVFNCGLWCFGVYSPLTTLRDDVILVIHDAGGNEVSRAGLFKEFAVEID